MNDLERLEQYWDRVANEFDAIYSGEKTRPSRLWDRLTRKNLHERLHYSLTAMAPLAGCTVLDVGCGSGRGAVLIAENGAARVVGIDVSSRMLELAARLAGSRGVGERCAFEHHDVLSLGDDRVFDHAVAMGFFDYVREPLPVMKALSGLVRHRLVASFPTRSSVRAPFRALWLRARGCPVRFFSEREVRELCEQSGFDVKELKRSGPIFLLTAQSRHR